MLVGVVKVKPVFNPLKAAAVSGAEPHCPFTGTSTGAEHEALVPPFDPPQLQLHGPVPMAADVVPDEQRLAVGALRVATPLADPHLPVIAGDPLRQMTTLPLETHSQSHTFVPTGAGMLGVPGLQRPVVGALLNWVPLAEPH